MLEANTSTLSTPPPTRRKVRRVLDLARVKPNGLCRLAGRLYMKTPRGNLVLVKPEADRCLPNPPAD